jgi:penicillin V acylase-like amidase (Ntn superfamily)
MRRARRALGFEVGRRAREDRGGEARHRRAESRSETMARTSNTAAAWFAAVLYCAAGPAVACSSFCLDAAGGPVFGKNYDWEVPDGLVIVNKRNVAKSGLTLENPALWTSRYGSVTFNQYGREMPNGGMNEAGLVVELMWLEEAEYPPADDRPSLQNLQWIQYQLDLSATVDDVIAGDSRVRIAREGQARVHFLVADSSGACAAIEFIGGRMVVHAGERMPAPVLTNDTYDRSVAFMETHQGFGGAAPIPLSRSSLDRFVRAAAAVSEFDPEAGDGPVDYAFGVLASVGQGEQTQWSIVYQMADLEVSFQTRGNTATRTIDLRRLDFSCDDPVRILDVNADLAGDVTGLFDPYTTEANRSLIESAFGKTSFLASTPDRILEQLVRYPETTYCRP